MDSESVKQRAKAFDYLYDAVVIVDLNGNIVDWNKGYLAGMNVKEITENQINKYFQNVKSKWKKYL